MNIFTCPKCGAPYNAGVSLAKRHVCRKQRTAADRRAAAEWRRSLGWREGQGFGGAGGHRPRDDEQRDLRIAATWAILSTLVSVLAGVRGRRRSIDWVKAARQPRAGGFGAGGDGGRAGD